MRRSQSPNSLLLGGKSATHTRTSKGTFFLLFFFVPKKICRCVLARYPYSSYPAVFEAKHGNSKTLKEA